MTYKRVSFDEYFMRLAHVAASMSTCISRKVGAVVAKDKKPIAMGFNGAASGKPHCVDSGVCVRRQMNVPSGQRMELCEALHAEENALLFAGIERAKGSTLYCTQEPCNACRRRVVNCGIVRVVIGAEKFSDEGRDELESLGVVCETCECPYLELPIYIPPPYEGVVKSPPLVEEPMPCLLCDFEPSSPSPYDLSTQGNIESSTCKIGTDSPYDLSKFRRK